MDMKRLAVLCALVLSLAGCAPAEEADRETVFQTALLQSLAQGYYDGIITVEELKRHGDTGIGTFEGVDGEMIVLDGTVYRAGSDGCITVAQDTVTVPFANVTFFDEDIRLSLREIGDMAALRERLDERVKETGRNLLYMVKITGSFPYVKVRSETAQEKPYRALDEALAADQVEYDHRDIIGTVVGLYCPEYLGGLNSVGWHFHFISGDLGVGGHVLEVSIGEAEAAMDATAGFAMLVTGEKAFQDMDLARDMDEVIDRAETAVSSNVTFGTLLHDLVQAYESPTGNDIARIDADVDAIGTDMARAVAEHWKKVYLDRDYPLYLYGRDDPALIGAGGSHAFVVLGYQLKDGEMTEELRGRCDAAAAAAAAFPDSAVVLSGGATGANNPEGHTEAGMMKKYLTEVCGIAEERIFTDESAMTTVENAVNTFKILRERGISSITLVTSSYHQRWGQVLYNALAQKYLEDDGVHITITGNYCFDIAPENEAYLSDARIAARQLGSILGLSREEMSLIPGAARKTDGSR